MPSSVLCIYAKGDALSLPFLSVACPNLHPHPRCWRMLLQKIPSLHRREEKEASGIFSNPVPIDGEICQ